MSGPITQYLDLIAPEHASSPNYISSVSVSIQPFSDITETLQGMPEDYDLDVAEGTQLDAVGLRVGASRYLSVPLVGVYFSWDTAGLGWEAGSWQGPFDPSTGLTTLPDDLFRVLIRATIAANQWDGTIPGAYGAYETALSPQVILIQNYGNMAMSMAMATTPPNAVWQAMFADGLLDLRPAGVFMVGRFIPGVAATPYFGFDVENSTISGFDVGAWGAPL